MTGEHPVTGDPPALATARQAALDTADWRRRVRALYDRVRASDDPRDGHRAWREGRDELLARHPASPLPAARRAGFTGLRYAAYDPGYRFDLPVLAAPPASLAVPTGTDGVVPFERVGVVELPGCGRLDVWWLGSYGGGVFLPVRDALAGVPGGTYGGGRYVLDTVKGADLGPGRSPGSLVVDLNFAYNPSCAYDPAWACPLAPEGNTTSEPLPVGELAAAAG